MKTNINLTCDVEVVLEARKRNVKLSSVVNSFLKDYLELDNNESEGDSIDNQLIAVKVKLDELEKKKEAQTPKRKVLVHIP
jgi:hypothetical protein